LACDDLMKYAANGILVGAEVETMREILSRMQCEAKHVELPTPIAPAPMVGGPQR